MTLAVALLGIPIIARGQTSREIDWASVLTAESDASISVDPNCTPDLRNPDYTICVTIANSAPPNFGYAMTDLVSYGDLAGDGQTDALVPLDSGGTVGISGFLVYRLEDSTPQLITAQSGYGGPNIDTNTNTLYVLVRGDGPNCCPTSMDRTSYKLVGDSLVKQGECTYVPTAADARVPQGPCTPVSASQQTTAPIAPGSSSCGSQLSAPRDLSCLNTFGGPVLMPPAGLQPFATLPFVSVANACRIDDCSNRYPASYSVSFSNPEMGQFNVPEASMAGAKSREMYSHDVASSMKDYSSCGATAAYCANRSLQPGCNGLGCLGGGEVFRGLTTRGVNAFVEHVDISHGAWRWSVHWFDDKAGVSYDMGVASDPELASFDGQGLNANNLAGAKQVAALADKLVLWSGS